MEFDQLFWILLLVTFPLVIPQNCGEDFACDNGLGCFNSTEKCDGTDQCSDRTDELGKSLRVWLVIGNRKCGFWLFQGHQVLTLIAPFLQPRSMCPGGIDEEVLMRFWGVCHLFACSRSGANCKQLAACNSHQREKFWCDPIKARAIICAEINDWHREAVIMILWNFCSTHVWTGVASLVVSFCAHM